MPGLAVCSPASSADEQSDVADSTGAWSTADADGRGVGADDRGQNNPRNSIEAAPVEGRNWLPGGSRRGGSSRPVQREAHRPPSTAHCRCPSAPHPWFTRFNPIPQRLTTSICPARNANWGNPKWVAKEQLIRMADQISSIRRPPWPTSCTIPGKRGSSHSRRARFELLPMRSQTITGPDCVC